MVVCRALPQAYFLRIGLSRTGILTVVDDSEICMGFGILSGEEAELRIVWAEKLGSLESGRLWLKSRGKYVARIPDVAK